MERSKINWWRRNKEGIHEGKGREAPDRRNSLAVSVLQSHKNQELIKEKNRIHRLEIDKHYLIITMSNRVCHFKLVLLGDTAVGKSCLVVRFVRDEFFEFQEPTIGGKKIFDFVK